MNYTQNYPFGGMNGGGLVNANKYPNPFCDIASFYLPNNLNDAFAWMEYLTQIMPPFQAVINRVVSYFLTDIEISDVADDIRDKYEKVFDDELHIIQNLQDIGKDYFCFSGDTEVYTSKGIRKMKDLAGTTAEICCIDGKWRKAAFKSYGIQKTRQVAFGTQKSVWVTDDHKWWVDRGDDGDTLSPVDTKDFKYWYRVPFLRIPRPKTNADYGRGVVHGAVLACGRHPTATDSEIIEAFEKQFNVKRTDAMRQVPKASASRSYWYGVFCGMAATRGYFQKGCRYFFITSADSMVLEECKAGFEGVGLITKTMATRKIWRGGIRHYLPFNCDYLEPEDFLIKEDRDCLSKCKAGTGKVSTGIRKVGTKTRKEEVFCCEEPVTHTFTLAGGVVTRNCYGNSFVSLYLPFERYLKCPDCGTEIHISRIDYKFEPKGARFMCSCPKCRMGLREFKHIDRRLRDTSKIHVIRWNPKRIKLKVHPISGEIKYYYKLEEKFVDKVRKGERFYIDTTQWGFIETACGGEGKKESTECLFEFYDGQIYHMRDTVYAGLQDRIKGWAIPPLLPYFKLAYYIQLMRRYDEAIALDFIMPFRILYPQGQAPGGQDALTMMSMQTFISAMSQMVEKKRVNMTAIEVSPFAIGYEMIGGEAKQLAPKESIQQAEQELLNAMGFPQELFAGTLTLQAAPVALRLFEREWNPLVDNMNTVLQWITDQISRYFMWDKATVRLTPITLADDLEKKNLQMQAAAGQDISKQTAYRAMGIDYLQEQQRIIKEQKDIQKMQRKALEDEQAQMANGAAGGESGGADGGDGSGMNGPGGDVGATPADIQDQAKQIASQLIAENNPSHTRQVLQQVKATNETLWSLVKGQLQEQRQQLTSQGRQMAIAQLQQGG